MKNTQPEPLKLSTRLTQLGRNTKEQRGFVNSPVYRGSTVVFDTVEDLENNRADFVYGTLGTPTIKNLEDAWTELTGAAGTVMSPSGLGAIALALMTTLKVGDHQIVLWRPRPMRAGRKEGAKLALHTVYIYSPVYSMLRCENETRLEIPILPNI